MDRTSKIGAAACILMFLLWTWLAPRPQPTPPAPVTAASTTSTTTPAAAPVANPTDATTPATAAPTPATAPEKTFSIKVGEREAIFSTYGGGLKKTILAPGQSFTGKDQTVLNEFGAASIGALSRGIGDLENAPYELKTAEGQFPIIFERTLPEGISVRKEWSPAAQELAAGFLWNLKITFKNNSAQTHQQQWHLYSGAVHPLRKSDQVPARPCWNADGSASFDGEGLIFDSFTPENSYTKAFPTQLLWAGTHSQHYAALIAHTLPIKDLPAGSLWSQRKKVDFSSHEKVTSDIFASEGAFGLPALSLAPGQEVSYALETYLGPRAYSLFSKLDNRADANRRFGDVMFYGWWGFISRIMLWMLTHLQPLFSWAGASWALALIALTLIVRGLMWPITLKSARSMKRMSLLSPQMKELQEKYKSDPQRMNMEVMRLYKRHGVNPVSGCLPAFLQIPVFFGLYRMLMGAAELRGHGLGWVQDLSMADTLFHLPAGIPFLGGMGLNPLPLLMAITMFIQMAMTPKSPDPNMQMQQKMLMIMPFGFLFICYNFAAALALYWTISNIVGIFQSWLMKRMPEPELKPLDDVEVILPGQKGGATAKSKPGFMEVFMERLAAQQKIAEEKKRGGK
jgi:YidC/Oxa1 family membrane protein insertase